MKLRLLSIFWGPKHYDLFKWACLKSLAYPRNKEALYASDTIWNIFTDDEYFEPLRELTKITFPGLRFEIRSTNDLRRYTDSTQSALVGQIEECLAAKAKFLFAPPDTIFGDGTVANLLKIGREDKTCVCVPHPRVLPDIQDAIRRQLADDGNFVPDRQTNIDNVTLVDLAFKYLHQSWTDAEVNHVRQNSHVGGVLWQRLDDVTISGRHYLPTHYLCDFTEQDLNYFKTQVSFGSFDHMWAGDILIPQGRQRYVGSSDAAFICEVTEKEKNIPPVWNGDPNQFWRNHVHNHHNKQVEFIFRGTV